MKGQAHDARKNDAKGQDIFLFLFFFFFGGGAGREGGVKHLR